MAAMFNSTLNSSFDENDAIDINSIIVQGESDFDVQKKLSAAFDGCVTKSPDDCMKVLLRIRPISGKTESTIVVESNTSILTNAPESSKRAQYTKTEARNYLFTKVFKPDASQFDVYNDTATPLLNRFFAGENCVMFAYGMTNSGKTYTMQGSNINPGILPRLVASIQEAMEAQMGKFDIKMSMLEIYQDKIFDLLGTRKEKLSIRDGNGKVEVHKLSYHTVATTADAFQLMDTAATNRTKATTFLNTNSSRSHAVYCITLTRENTDGVESTASFYLVDLAGAERGNRTRATATQQKEANNINVSLMQLWRCLHGMKRNNRGKIDDSIIPFRESKLTHLLMPILCRAGLKGVSMMVCVNPQVEDYDETISILANASLASRIREIVDLGRTVTAQLMAPPEIKEKVYGMSLHTLKEYKDKNPNRSSVDTDSSAGATSVNTEVVSVPVGASSAALAAASGTGNKKRGRDSTLTTSSAAAVVVAAASKPIVSTYAQHNKGNKKTATKPVAAPVKTVTHNADFDGGDDDDQQDVKRMRSEIDELRQENLQLMNSQHSMAMQRETEIRIEVSEEMAASSQHLLDEIEYLREQLSTYENASTHATDLTRSVKKAAQRQKEIVQINSEHELREAEEEFERMKGEYEAEVTGLKTKVGKLESELKQYSALRSVMQAGAANKAKPKTTMKNLMAFGSNSKDYAENALEAAAAAGSKEEYNKRFARGAGDAAGVNQENQQSSSSFLSLQAVDGTTKVGAVSFQKSPSRSPLSNVSPNAGQQTKMGRSNSPLNKPAFKVGINATSAITSSTTTTSPQRMRTAGGMEVLDLTGQNSPAAVPYFKKLRSHFGRA